MNAQQRKIIRDHAARAGHLVALWDSSDFSWYARHKMPRDNDKKSERRGQIDEAIRLSKSRDAKWRSLRPRFLPTSPNAR